MKHTNKINPDLDENEEIKMDEREKIYEKTETTNPELDREISVNPSVTDPNQYSFRRDEIQGLNFFLLNFTLNLIYDVYFLL